MRRFSTKDKAEYVMRNTLVKQADAIVDKAYRAAGFSGTAAMESESWRYLMGISIKDMFDGKMPDGNLSDEHRIGDTMLLRYNDENKAFEISLLLTLNGQTGISMRVMHYEDGSLYIFDHESGEWSLYIPDNDK